MVPRAHHVLKVPAPPGAGSAEPEAGTWSQQLGLAVSLRDGDACAGEL